MMTTVERRAIASRRRALACLVVMLTLVSCSPALAAGPLVSGYGGEQGVIGNANTGTPSGGNGGSGGGGGGGGGTAPAGGSATAPVSTASVAEPGSLPFTGQQVGLVLASGALLFGAGLALRRVAGRPGRRLAQPHPAASR